MSEGTFYLIRGKAVAKDIIDRVAKEVAELLAKGPVFVKLGAYEKPRSLDQNAMHCGLCRDIAKQLSEQTGLDYDVEYIRAKTKRQFGVRAEQIDPMTGKPEPYLVSTAKYTAKQFSVLIDGTLAWAHADLGLRLVDPRR